MVHLVPFISVSTPFLSHFSHFTALVYKPVCFSHAESPCQNDVSSFLTPSTFPCNNFRQKSCLMSISFGKLVPSQSSIIFPFYGKFAGFFYVEMKNGLFIVGQYWKWRPCLPTTFMFTFLINQQQTFPIQGNSGIQENIKMKSRDPG